MATETDGQGDRRAAGEWKQIKKMTGSFPAVCLSESVRRVAPPEDLTEDTVPPSAPHRAGFIKDVIHNNMTHFVECWILIGSDFI